jgi:Cu+-exporting ATPase
MNKRFSVTGMTCSACSAHVERAVSKLAGVNHVQVNLLTASMTVTFDETAVSEQDIVQAVIAAGYGASGEKATAVAPLADTKKAASALAEKQDREMKRRLWWSLVFLALLMTVSMGHMVGIPLPSFMSGHGGAVNFALTQLLLCLPILYLNRAYYKKGIPALLRGNPNMDSLVAVGSLAHCCMAFLLCTAWHMVWEREIWNWLPATTRICILNRRV